MIFIPDLLRPFFRLIVPEGVAELAGTGTLKYDPVIGSIAILLNFRRRFVFGLIGEMFSLCESDSFPAMAETRDEFQDSDRFFRVAETVLPVLFISSESVS